MVEEEKVGSPHPHQAFRKVLFEPLFSWCSFSMMVKWVNDGLLQANDGKMLVNDGGMLVNDGEMSVWYTYFTIISLM